MPYFGDPRYVVGEFHVNLAGQLTCHCVKMLCLFSLPRDIVSNSTMLLSLDWSVGISSKSAAKDRQNTKYKKNIPEQLLWEVSNRAVGVNTSYERHSLPSLDLARSDKVQKG